jgi:predicted nucleic acid-binding protein
LIIFDASAVVSAALKVDSVPERALLHAEATDVFALSTQVDDEIAQVLRRPKFAGVLSVERREHEVCRPPLALTLPVSRSTPPQPPNNIPTPPKQPAPWPRIKTLTNSTPT